MASEAETVAMRRALALARARIGSAFPNVCVGAVVLDAAGQIAGEGWSAPGGGAHAEVVALGVAGERASGGTVIVTLEPCAHVGRNGPCSDALVAAGVGRLVYAVDDPNPIAAGGGERLRERGLDVESGLLVGEAEQVHETWLGATRLGRPHVTWKYAATLDGRVAAADRTSRWITGPDARADAHRLRSECDAVLVGVGTVLADNPALTVRDPQTGVPALRQPLRVVADTEGRTPAAAAVRDGAGPSLLITAQDVARAGDGRGLDPAGLLALLGEREVRSVLLEGGPRLAGSFLAAGLVDRVVGYVAPALLGAGPAAVETRAFPTIGAARRFRLDEVSQVGSDLRLVARPGAAAP